jgi:hypothetical protein
MHNPKFKGSNPGADGIRRKAQKETALCDLRE